MIKNNISVLIGSCDKYEPIWKNFQLCFDKTWKHHTDNIFVTENKNVNNYTPTKFQTVKSNKKSWGERMLDGIASCQSKYIFFILDDYLFTYSYSENQLVEYINLMNHFSIDRLQISPSSFQHYEKYNEVPTKFLKISQHSLYSISMQPSIWNKEYLESILLPTYSPWDFEIDGSSAINTNYKKHHTMIDTSVPNVYFNAIRKGFLKSEGWEEFRLQNCLEDF